MTSLSASAAYDADSITALLEDIRRPLHIVQEGNRIGVGIDPVGEVIGSLPPLYPEWLGDRGFAETHGVRFPYVTGAMANGIATPELVIAMGRAEMVGFFGAAGLSPTEVGNAVDAIQDALGERPWGTNLIHSPNEPELEHALVDLYLTKGARRVSASAYLALSPAIVRYMATGLHQVPQGHIHRQNFVFAKVSRPEVARHFMSPPPRDMLGSLVSQGLLTQDEARLAERLPVSEDITVEADSGGHTDNQPLTAIFPTLVALRSELAARHGYSRPIRLGAAGGLGTPAAVAAAFSLGASYVLTGSINQSAVESGLSEEGRAMLSEAALGDVMMAPAADMFEQGTQVQVLKRGTLFGMRAKQLYEIYLRYGSLEELPEPVRAKLEARVLGVTIGDIWTGTEAFFRENNPKELERAQRDPKHRMALVFRWYLGLSSKWAIAGLPERRADYQIWCGPAMGAFNAWVRGSFLEPVHNRGVVQIAHNLLEGAAVITRAQQLRTFGVPVPPDAFHYRPREIHAAEDAA